MNKGLRKLKNQNIFDIAKILILFVILGGFAVAQTQLNNHPIPKPSSKKTPKPKPHTVCPECEVEAPVTPETPPTSITRSNGKDSLKDGRRIENEDDIPYEKSIQVESDVSINLQVCEGNVRINGWDRDEVRVFVSGGSKVGFKAAAPKRKNGKTASITVLGFDPKVDKGDDLSTCLYGDEIEIDVPMGARFSKIVGRDAKFTIKSLAKVSLENTEGEISLSDIQEEINVKTYNGDITVENSSGTIHLETFDGDVFVYNSEPLDTGDVLTIKANNSIYLQSVSHSIIEANSTSGSITYSGEIQTDGQYSFKNNKGNIALSIPEESSCMVEVLVQKGRFSFIDLPIKVITENKSPVSVQKIVGQMGEGEATINIVSASGRILIRKLK